MNRLQHRVFVIDGQLLKARIFHPDAVGNPSVIKQVPAETRATEELEAVGFKQVAETAAVSAAGLGISGAAAEQTEGAEQFKGRKQFGFGYTDQRGLGGDLIFSQLDIGPPPQQFRRNVHHYL